MKKQYMFLAVFAVSSIVSKKEEVAPRAVVPTLSGLFKAYSDKISAPVEVRKKILVQFQSALKNPDLDQLIKAFSTLLQHSPGVMQDVLVQIGAFTNEKDRPVLIEAYLTAAGIPQDAQTAAVSPVEQQVRMLPVARLKKVEIKHDALGEYRAALETQMAAMRGLFDNKKYYKIIPPLVAPKIKEPPKKIVK